MKQKPNQIKKVKDLKLDKKVITNLNQKEMEFIMGGGEGKHIIQPIEDGGTGCSMSLLSFQCTITIVQ